MRIDIDPKSEILQYFLNTRLWMKICSWKFLRTACDSKGNICKKIMESNFVDSGINLPTFRRKIPL